MLYLGKSPRQRCVWSRIRLKLWAAILMTSASNLMVMTTMKKRWWWWWGRLLGRCERGLWVNVVCVSMVGVYGVVGVNDVWWGSVVAWDCGVCEFLCGLIYHFELLYLFSELLQHVHKFKTEQFCMCKM